MKLSLETIRTTQEVFQIDDKLTRRQFIQDSAAAGAAIGAGIVLSNSAHASSTGKILNYNSDMEYRRCGRTGLMISAICLGGHWKRLVKIIGGSEPEGWMTTDIDGGNFQKNRHEVMTPYTAKSKLVTDESGLWAALRKYDIGWFGIKPFASNSLFKGDSSPDSPYFEQDNRIARLALRHILCTPAVNSERAEVRPTAAAGDKAESTGGPPPLVVNSDAPLLLDEPTEEQQASTGMTTQAAVENAACFVCHANYRSEALASDHAKANVGCSGCHGQSFAHRNDENNTTPPGKMYSVDKIDSFCQGCHNSHDVAPGKVAALWAKRNPDKNDPDKIVCTDCHGEHRMKVRTIIWDKKTGKLLRTNRGE